MEKQKKQEMLNKTLIIDNGLKRLLLDNFLLNRNLNSKIFFSSSSRLQIILESIGNYRKYNKSYRKPVF